MTQPRAWVVGALDIRAGCMSCCDRLVVLAGMEEQPVAPRSPPPASPSTRPGTWEGSGKKDTGFLQVVCIIRIDVVSDRCGFPFLLGDSCFS